MCCHRSALSVFCLAVFSFFFLFYLTATPAIYTLSLHDALPISVLRGIAGGIAGLGVAGIARYACAADSLAATTDRKSTRLNSSHLGISYAVFCLKKKRKTKRRTERYTDRRLIVYSTCI